MALPDPKNQQTVDARYVADLARIELTDEETRNYQAQLEDILAYIEQLSQLDVEGIEPTAHGMPLHNIMREDKTEPSLDRREVMKNAPAVSAEELFQVPAILEEDEGGNG